MKTVWTKGKDSQLEADIKSAFKSSTVVRSRLAEICEEKIAAAMTTHKNQYDGPNWAYEQSDAIGYRRALEEIVSLLEK
jgi:hypothetical protein